MVFLPSHWGRYNNRRQRHFNLLILRQCMLVELVFWPSINNSLSLRCHPLFRWRESLLELWQNIAPALPHSSIPVRHTCISVQALKIQRFNMIKRVLFILLVLRSKWHLVFLKLLRLEYLSELRFKQKFLNWHSCALIHGSFTSCHCSNRNRFLFGVERLGKWLDIGVGDLIFRRLFCL